MICRLGSRLHALANADAPILAICRSTTEVNSSTITLLGASQIRRAKPARNCSPLLSTLKGRNQAGTSPSPTAERAEVTSFIDLLGAISSIIGRFGFQPSVRLVIPLSHICLPIEDFPLPEGPTISPICHPSSSMGRLAVCSQVCPFSALKRDFTFSARKVLKFSLVCLILISIIHLLL